jgi:hypothetical protein
VNINLDKVLKAKIKKLLLNIKQHGLTWKPKKDEYHLLKRKRRQHIPEDWELKDNTALIMNILNDKENNIYIYFKETFKQNYFVFTDGNAWIVIMGEDGIMETAMIADNYDSYLHSSKGYKYLGLIKEVFE